VIYAAIPVVLAVVAMALGRRLLALLLILGYLTMEGFLKLLSNYHPVVHVGIDIIVLSLGLWLVLEAVIRRRAHLPMLPWTPLIAAYVLWVTLQLLNPHSPGLVPSLASLKVHLAMIPLYFITATMFRSPRDLHRFLAGMAVISLVPYTMALGQYALGPASVLDLSPRFWQNISYYHEWRPFGTSATPGGASVFAFLYAPLAFVLLVSPVSRRVKALAVLSLTLAAATFVVSGVRQLFLGSVLVLLTMAALMASRARSGGFVALVFVAVISLGAYVGVQTWLRPMATENVAREARAPQIWRERDVTTRLLTLAERSTYREARASPVSGILFRATRYPIGAGLGRTGSTAGTFQAQYASDPESANIQALVGWSDNFFSDMIVEVGIPGMLMLTTVLLGMLAGAIRLARRAQDVIVAVTAAALAGLFFAILAMSWGSQPLLSNPITALFWVFAGLLAAMRRMEAEAADTVLADDDPGALPLAVAASATR
jgi:hypothetical protein